LRSGSPQRRTSRRSSASSKSSPSSSVSRTRSPLPEETLSESLFGERRVAEVLIGHREGEPVGFALFFHSFSTFLGKPGIYLEDLYVRPKFRGAGIGRALLVHLAKLARERDCGRLEWSVLNWNEPAIGFYETLGAVPMDEWTVYRLTGDALEELAAEEFRDDSAWR
jgi:GNAT superfamily N-acetyltransferase